MPPNPEVPMRLPTVLLLLAGPFAAGRAHAAEELSLDEALSRLDARNTTIAQARARTEEARGVVGLASAALLPAVAAQGGWTRNSDEAVMDLGVIFDGIENAINELIPTPVTLDRSQVPDALVIQPLEQWSAGGSVRVPLIVAHAWADVGAARDAVDASEAASDTVRLQVQGALVEACWMASAAEGFVEAREHAAETALAHRDSAQRRLQAGQVTRLDVLRAETELATRQSDLAQSRADLERAHRGLGMLLGSDEPVQVRMPEAAQLPLPDDPLAMALQHRPDLLARQAAVDAAHRQLLSARLRNLPDVHGSFAASTSDVPYPTGETTMWRAGITATWVLYDGGARWGMARKAQGSITEAEAALEGDKLQVHNEVADALAAIEVAQTRLQLAQARLATAREGAAAADRGYESGVVDNLQVLDANDALLMSEVAHQQAVAALGIAQAQLRWATGQGW